MRPAQMPVKWQSWCSDRIDNDLEEVPLRLMSVTIGASFLSCVARVEHSSRLLMHETMQFASHCNS